MRLIPLLTATVVTAFLVALVLFREPLLQFAATPVWTADASEQDAVPSASEPEATKTETSKTEKSETELSEPQADTQTAANTNEGRIPVIALRSKAREVDSAVILRGETKAARQVDVRAETSAVVISEPLRKGSFVSKGQLLCELDPGTRNVSLSDAKARLAEAIARQPETEARIPEAEARLIEAQARLDEALVNDNAARKLSADGYASETRVKSAEAGVRAAEAAVSAAQSGVKAARSGLDSTQAGIQSAEASVAAAQKELDRLKIMAPFEGILEMDTAELGSLLQPGGLCGTILQLNPMKLVGFVPETDVARIELGARATAKLATGANVSGRVSFLARSADEMTRTFRVEIDVDNADLSIRDGQTAEMIISAPGNLAHLLPASALTLDDTGALGVRVVDENETAQFMPVTLLRDTREGVWATGLPDSAQVITLGQEYVTNGVPVRATFEELKP